MENSKKNITKRTILLIVAVVVICISAGILIHKYVSENNAQNKFESLTGGVTSSGDTIGKTPEAEIDIFTYLGIKDPKKVIDWERLWEQNDDIYAWIYVPGTKIDYPILQHETDDTYYLEYNLDGSKGYPGCIYTERINSKDFTDHNTLIYGHNMKNGTMFKDVHKFADEEFFEKNRFIFIYTPEKLFVYDIFAAYRFTSDHIMYNYDCVTQNGFALYLQMIQDDYRNSGNFRDLEVTGEDRIITLSTCVSGQSDKRQLLQAVLIEFDGSQTSYYGDSE